MRIRSFEYHENVYLRQEDVAEALRAFASTIESDSDPLSIQKILNKIASDIRNMTVE